MEEYIYEYRAPRKEEHVEGCKFDDSCMLTCPHRYFKKLVGSDGDWIEITKGEHDVAGLV